MKILVTGGAGFIGSNVVELLVERGDTVYVLDDFSHAHFKNLQGLHCELICGDILDKNIYTALPSLDAVIHEAAVTDTTLKDDKKMVMVNFEGFKNTLRYCLGEGIPLVYASSAGVYGDGASPMKEDQEPRPLNTYAYSKYLCDQQMQKIIQRHTSPLIVGLRYFNVYGPGEYHKGSSASMIYQLYLQMRNKKSPRVFKSGQQKRDFIYVKDIAQVTVRALALKKSTIMNVGTGVARSFNDIIAALNKALGADLSPDYFDNPYAGVYQDHTEADITLLKKHAQFSPQYSLESGIEDYCTRYLACSPHP